MRDPARSPTESSGVIVALLSALFFGITTPLAKLLLADVSPVLMAGLLYLGSGLGLAGLRALQDGGWSPTYLSRADSRWLLGGTLAGCVAAPLLLLTGLAAAEAGSAALLLNLEVVFTALIAGIAFRERMGIRTVLGLLGIAAGAAALVWPAAGFPGQTQAALGDALPLLAIIGACLCWGVDNTLTRRISGGDARAIAMVKGLAGGLINTVLALSIGIPLPSELQALGCVALGFLGYGLSLMFFILALRQLGAARTSAYFAAGPFIGAVLALLLYGAPDGHRFWLAGLAMAAGVWLLVTERHDHLRRREEGAVPLPPDASGWEAPEPRTREQP